MARLKKDDSMDTVSVRLPKEMVKEIDSYVESLKGDMPLLNISRADGVRQLLANALKAELLAVKKKSTQKK